MPKGEKVRGGSEAGIERTLPSFSQVKKELEIVEIYTGHRNIVRVVTAKRLKFVGMGSSQREFCQRVPRVSLGARIRL